jgi:hypothetical protein
MHGAPTTNGFGTVTLLAFGSTEATAHAVAVLEDLVTDMSGRPGFIAGHVLRTDETEVLLVTIYASVVAADQLSAEFRPRLAETVGALVVRPPERWAGPLAVNTEPPR